MVRLYRLAISAALLTAASLAHAAPLEIKVLYIEQEPDRPPVLSNLVVRPEDEGEQGAVLGISDNNTTGKFLKHDYLLDKILVAKDQDFIASVKDALKGAKLIIANIDASNLHKLADLPDAADDLIFNAGSADINLRDMGCRANMLHTLPSRAMLTDALMQFLKKRKWESVFLLEGNRGVDTLFAESVRRSAKKYRIDIDHEKKWIEESDMRRSASSEIPKFTQARNYDVIVVADEDDDFGQYVLYNSWLPRPVAGTTGLEAIAWDGVVEQWGALQLQSRFEETAKRSMTSLDYAAWAAARSIGEAVTRTGSVVPTELQRYILSESFSLAGFKGAKMTFRTWNGQLRQPIPLVHPRSVVALAPIEGFLHQKTELDTLGLDQPESACKDMEIIQ